MHKLGIVHRDIKSHNVLITDTFQIKVCDFGLAKFNVSHSSHFKKPLNLSPLAKQLHMYNRSFEQADLGKGTM